MQIQTRSILPAPQTQTYVLLSHNLMKMADSVSQWGRVVGGGEARSEATIDHPLMGTQAPVDQGRPKLSRANRRTILAERARPVST